MAPAAPRLIQEKCQSSVRWVVLVLACWMMVGSYYCFDIPAALKTQIDDYMGDPSDYEIKFGLLYTLYSAPNVSENSLKPPSIKWLIQCRKHPL
jgi:hypothetical protein